MEFGIGYFPTHDAVGPGPLARMLEERGFESLLFAEHTHIPASRESPWPAGGPLPRKYWHTYDIFVALTAAATATSRLRIGSGITLITERDPIITAKEAASVDHLSGGRLEFGVGAGWNREEMLNHGTDPRTRMRLFKERVEAIKAIWTQEEASYHGEFVNFDAIWSYPKPVQRPHPPVLVGGQGPTVIDRVLAFGDAWIPNYARGRIFDQLADLRARADRPIDFQVISVPANPDDLEKLAKAGCTRALYWLPSVPMSQLEPALVAWEQAIAEFTGNQ